MALVRGMHPAQAARSGIARTHRTGHWTARACRGTVDAPNGQPARINSAAPCPEHALLHAPSGHFRDQRRHDQARGATAWRFASVARPIDSTQSFHRLARDFYVAVRIGAVKLSRLPSQARKSILTSSPDRCAPCHPSGVHFGTQAASCLDVAAHRTVLSSETSTESGAQHPPSG